MNLINHVSAESPTTGQLNLINHVIAESPTTGQINLIIGQITDIIHLKNETI
jgi:hypothetical protein